MAPITRRLAARTAADYDNEVHGRRGSDQPPDDRTLNPHLGRFNLVRPSHKGGPLVFRASPLPDYAHPDTRLQPGRKSRNPRGQSAWCVRVVCAPYVGVKEASPVTFALWDPRDDGPDQWRQNPYAVFYKAAKAAFEAGEFGNGRGWIPQWNRLFQGKKGSGAAVSPPTPRWFFQGAVYQAADKFYVGGDREAPLGYDESDDLTVIQLSVGAGDKLIDYLDTEKPTYDPDLAERDPATAFRFGDPVGRFDPEARTLNGGVIFQVFNPTVTRAASRFTTYDPDAPPAKSGIQGYEVAFLSKYSYKGREYAASQPAAVVERIFGRAQWWLDEHRLRGPGSRGLVYIGAVEEQAHWVAKAFAPVAKLVSWAWEENPEFKTDEVRGVLAARASAVVPRRSGDEDEDEADDAPENGRERPARGGARFRTGTPVADAGDGDEFADDPPARPAARRTSTRPQQGALFDAEDAAAVPPQGNLKPRRSQDALTRPPLRDPRAARPASGEDEEVETDEFGGDEDELAAEGLGAPDDGFEGDEPEPEDDEPEAAPLRGRSGAAAGRRAPEPQPEPEEDDLDELTAGMEDDEPVDEFDAGAGSDDDLAAGMEDDEPVDGDDEFDAAPLPPAARRAAAPAPAGARPAPAQLADDDEFADPPAAAAAAPQRLARPAGKPAAGGNGNGRPQPVTFDSVAAEDDEFAATAAPATSKPARAMKAAEEAATRAASRAKAPRPAAPAPPAAPPAAAAKKPAARRTTSSSFRGRARARPAPAHYR